jgi:hypothetical protein
MLAKVLLKSKAVTEQEDGKREENMKKPERKRLENSQTEENII